MGNVIVTSVVNSPGEEAMCTPSVEVSKSCLHLLDKLFAGTSVLYTRHRFPSVLTSSGDEHQLACVQRSDVSVPTAFHN